MIISITPTSTIAGAVEPAYLTKALELLHPAIGPIRFVAGVQGDLQLTLVTAAPDWQEWQLLAVDPAAPTRRAQVAIRSRQDWYLTREAALLAWAVLADSVRLLVGPECEPHPLPKTCLNQVIPTDRIEAFSQIRGGYLCKGCCETLLARGVSPFAVSQLQDATQLVRAVLLVPQLYQPQPGRLRLVERQEQVVAELPDYGVELLPLEPLQLAFYLLLVRHEEGVPTDVTSELLLKSLTSELADLYQRTNPFISQNIIRSKAAQALRSSRQRELSSFLNACLKAHTPTSVVHEYQIELLTLPTGLKKRHVRLNRTHIEDLAGILSPGSWQPQES